MEKLIYKIQLNTSEGFVQIFAQILRFGADFFAFGQAEHPQKLNRTAQNRLSCTGAIIQLLYVAYLHINSGRVCNARACAFQWMLAELKLVSTLDKMPWLSWQLRNHVTQNAMTATSVHDRCYFMKVNTVKLFC